METDKSRSSEPGLILSSLLVKCSRFLDQFYSKKNNVLDNQDSIFWSEFEKKLAEKNSFNEVIMKIATHKKSKDSREALE